MRLSNAAKAALPVASIGATFLLFPPIEALGFTAMASSLGGAYLQGRKNRLSGKSDDVSLPTWAISYTGDASWYAYGLATKMPPIIAANVLSLFLKARVISQKMPHWGEVKKSEFLSVPFKLTAAYLAVAAAGAAICHLCNFDGILKYTEQLAGIAGTVLGIAAAYPQAFKTWMSKRAEDISLGAQSLLMISTVLWGAYGAFSGKFPILFTNAAAFPAFAAVLLMKIIFKNQNQGQ